MTLYLDVWLMLSSREDFFPEIFSMLVGTDRLYTQKRFKKYQLETLFEDDNVKARGKYGTPEGTFSFLFLSCTHKLLTRFNKHNNSFNRLFMSFEQVICLV